MINNEHFKGCLINYKTGSILMQVREKKKNELILKVIYFILDLNLF